MSGYVPSMVLLGGLYLEHRKEKLDKQFDTDEAWQEFMQFIKNKQADAWEEGANALEHHQMHVSGGWPTNPYRKQEEA